MADQQVHGAEYRVDYGTEVDYWDAELKAAEKVNHNWMQLAGMIERRYKLESNTLAQRSACEQVQHPLVEHSDAAAGCASDGAAAGGAASPQGPGSIGRLASEVLGERALAADLDIMVAQGGSIGIAMERVAIDVLLVGRGVPWVRYDAKMGEIDGKRIVISEASPIEYIHWSDFLHQPARTWHDVATRGWVARRVDMSREEGLRFFGEVFKDVPLNQASPGFDLRESGIPEGTRAVFGKAQVWENLGSDDEERHMDLPRPQGSGSGQEAGPVEATGFFPCPMPAYGTLGNNNLVPSPDYQQYQALADELDDQTARIEDLTQALRVAGWYDSSAEGLGRLLDTDEGNVLIPVPGLSGVTGQNGIKDVVQFLPMANNCRGAGRAVRRSGADQGYAVRGQRDF